MYLCLFLVDYLCVFFFFKQKTAYEMRISDWSSDVCSSDLIGISATPRCFAFSADDLSFAKAGEIAVADKVKEINAATNAFVTSAPKQMIGQIGRASCRERVCQYV